MSAAVPAPWWQGAVLYQVYVRSFRDTDGDGYGDLRGVIQKLDHLSWLGVDGIWLSPTMPSPDTDWGYDVSDYRDVHPELGELSDLDELIAEAARRGIRTLLDLVPNHTSDAHAWFVDARSSREAEHRQYYVWADPAPGGGPPNNWLDATGECAWELDEATGQYYLHNFLRTQPDLNWWDPRVHHEFRDILRFWWDRGVAGFRIDVAHGLYKDAELRDNPPALPGDPEGRHGALEVYSANRPETHGIYRHWRKMAEGYDTPRLLLGETFVLDVARLRCFYGEDDELQMAFNFPFVFSPFTATGLSAIVGRTLDLLPDRSCPIWMGSNHDVGRFPTRWASGDERKVRLALTILLTLPGAAVLYYGDEIGMADVAVPDHLQRDPMSRHGRGGGFSRDRARTPLPWTDGPGAGFTAAERPWLPLPDDLGVNVAAQRDDPGSVLALCRRLVSLRHRELGAAPAYRALATGPQCWAYQVGDLVVAANLSGGTLTTIPGLASGPSELALLSSGGVEWHGALSPWEAAVLQGPTGGQPPGPGRNEQGPRAETGR